MTYADVATAAAVLRSQGVLPSGNRILTWMHGQGQKASKRTILKFLKQGAGAPTPMDQFGALQVPSLQSALQDTPAQAEVARIQEPPPAPVAVQEPVAPAPAVSLDPVVRAEEALTAAEEALVVAREAMQHQVMALSLVNGYVLDGRRYGHLHPDDPERQYLQGETQRATGEYYATWERVTQARQAHTQAVQAYRKRHQEQWIAVHQPDLPAQKAYWAECLRTATSNHL